MGELLLGPIAGRLRSLAQRRRRDQHTLQLRQQHVGETGLDEDLGRARFACAFQLRRERIGRDDDDRDGTGGRVAAQQPAQLEPVDPRQPRLGDDHVWMSRQRLCEPLAAVSCFLDVVMSEAQILGVHRARIVVAVHEERERQRRVCDWRNSERAWQHGLLRL